jgi:2-oxoglutarate ferredoxin oxidoreductase subunit gamma
MSTATERIGGAGKGGAGLLTCLKTLGYAASARGWQMSYTSNYNPETRGGLVEGTVVISPEGPVISPVLDSFSSVLAFDNDGYSSYGSRLEPGGLIVWDGTRIFDPPALPEVTSYSFPTYEIAHGVDAPRSANMVLLGAWNRIRGLFTLDELSEAMREFLPSWRHSFVELNRRVLDAVEELDLDAYRVS